MIAVMTPSESISFRLLEVSELFMSSARFHAAKGKFLTRKTFDDKFLP